MPRPRSSRVSTRPPARLWATLAPGVSSAGRATVRRGYEQPAIRAGSGPESPFRRTRSCWSSDDRGARTHIRQFGGGEGPWHRRGRTTRRCRRRPLSPCIPVVEVAIVPEPHWLSGSAPDTDDGLQRAFLPSRRCFKVCIHELSDQRGHADSHAARFFLELAVLLHLQRNPGSMHAGGLPLGEQSTYIIRVDNVNTGLIPAQGRSVRGRPRPPPDSVAPRCRASFFAWRRLRSKRSAIDITPRVYWTRSREPISFGGEPRPSPSRRHPTDPPRFPAGDRSDSRDSSLPIHVGAECALAGPLPRPTTIAAARGRKAG